MKTIIIGVFKDTHEQHTVGYGRDYKELKRMLSESIERGYVERIPVMKPSRFGRHHEWYLDKETGEIYVLVEPEEDGHSGWWDSVDPSDLVDPGETVQ